MDSRSRRAVVLALDEEPRNVLRLELVAPRIREHNLEIPIHVVFRDRIPALSQTFCSLPGVTVRSLTAEGMRVPWFLMGTFLKWYAVAALADYEDVIYLDTDTIVFDDIGLLFDEVGEASFAARSFEPFLTERGRCGILRVDPCVGFMATVRRLAELLGIEPTLHFNSGIMVFRHGFTARIARELPRLERLFRLFMFGVLPVPFNIYLGGVWLIDEVCGRFFVVMCGLTHVHSIRVATAPFWVEYLAREAPPRGVVMHTWAGYYKAALREFAHPEEIERFDAVKSSALRSIPILLKPHLLLGLGLLQLSFLPRLRRRFARWYLALPPDGAGNLTASRR